MTYRRSLEIAVPDDSKQTPYSGIPVVPAEGITPARPVKPAREYADCRSTTLTDLQIAEYRNRLARGFYASPAVVREVARRIIESGDV